MVILFSGAAWVVLVLCLLFRALRQFRSYRRFAVSAASKPSVAASVSIIVPARNEIENIDLCLDGLRAQTGLSGGWSITVVDDESLDGTAAVIAEWSAGDSRIRLVPAGALPEGWIGKPHARWPGGSRTRVLPFGWPRPNTLPERGCIAILRRCGKGCQRMRQRFWAVQSPHWLPRQRHSPSAGPRCCCRRRLFSPPLASRRRP